MQRTGLIVAVVVLGLVAIVWIIVRKPATVDTRPWWQQQLDAITPDHAKVGYGGLGIELGF